MRNRVKAARRQLSGSGSSSSTTRSSCRSPRPLALSRPHRQQKLVVMWDMRRSNAAAAEASANPPYALLTDPTPAKLSRHTRYRLYGSSSGSSCASVRPGGTSNTGAPPVAAEAGSSFTQLVQSRAAEGWTTSTELCGAGMVVGAGQRRRREGMRGTEEGGAKRQPAVQTPAGSGSRCARRPAQPHGPSRTLTSSGVRWRPRKPASLMFSTGMFGSGRVSYSIGLKM